MIDLRMHLESALGFGVASLARLGGGDVAESYRVTLGDGGVVFAKTKRDAPPRFFSTEAAGLAWLGEVDAARIPHVLAVSDDPALLVLEWVEPGIPTRSTEAEFGRALAALHGAGAASFGREDRRSTGSRGLPQRAMCDLGRVLRIAATDTAGETRPRWPGAARVSRVRFGACRGPAR